MASNHDHDRNLAAEAGKKLAWPGWHDAPGYVTRGIGRTN
jgi:hypothetical protein